MRKLDAGVVRVSLLYLLLAALWIGVTDAGLLGLVPVGLHGPVSAAKGLLFILLTAAFLLTQLDRLHAQWRQAEQRFLELAESVDEAFWLYDLATGRILYLSPVFERIFLRGRSTLLNRSFDAWLETVHPEDRARVAAAALGIEEHGTFDETYRIVRPDGSLRWIWDRGYPSRDEKGRLLRVAGVARDVTESRRTAEELRASEESYRTLFELSPEPMMVHCRGRFVRVNAALLRLLGASGPEDLIGREVLERVHPDCHGLMKARMRMLVEERRPLAELTRLRFLRLDGLPVEVEAMAAPFTYQGEPAAQVFLRDVTERARFEARLQEAQKMEAVGQLAGGVAHDFNNLLAVIQGNAVLLRDGSGHPEAAAAEILDASRRAAVLTQQLLVFSRKQAMDRKRLSLSEVTRDVLGMLNRVLGEDIEVVAELADDLPPVLADEIMIEQVVMNLAVNARDAMPHGGQLRLRTHRASREGHDFVSLTVSDTGCGIGPDTLPHIFEPFFTTKEVGRGTGLGLAAVYGIVEQHEGRLHVESEPGRGTTFHVLLPAAEGHAAQRTLPAPTVVRAKATETILLVEDDTALRKLAERILSQYGYRVLSAGDGPAALEVWRERGAEVDMVLSDLVMPGGMTGLQLCERLRGERPELKVLFTSGYSPDLLNRRSAAPDDPDTFLAKPYTPQQLIAAVQRCLDGVVPLEPPA